MIHCLALSAALDVTYVVHGFAAGEIHRPTSVLQTAGGKALNVARVLERLGNPVSVLAVLGGHNGRRVRDLLVTPDGSIDLQVIEVEHETRTCVTVASDGALTELYEPVAAIDADTWMRFADAAVASVAGGDWVALSGSQPAGITPQAFSELVGRLRERGALIAVDSHGPALGALVAARPELVKVNRAEAAGLFAAGRRAGLLPIGPDVAAPDAAAPDAAAPDAAALAARLAALTGGTAVVTDGENGSFGASADAAVIVRPDTQRGAYPVGSGDAYLGGLLHGLAGDVSLPQAMRFAAACASANAAILRAGAFELDDVEAAFERIVVA